MDDGNLAAKTLVKEQVWMEVCSAAFDVLLEGFCRVKKCSKEGRAAMGMDLSALHSGLDSIHPNRTAQGKTYVEALCVKVSYMQDNEVLQWVQDNYQSYSYRCVLGIITNKMSSMLNPMKLKNAISLLDKLYNCDEDEDSSKLSSIMSSLSSSSSSGAASLTAGLTPSANGSSTTSAVSSLTASMSNLTSNISQSLSSSTTPDSPSPAAATSSSNISSSTASISNLFGKSMMNGIRRASTIATNIGKDSQKVDS